MLRRPQHWRPPPSWYTGASGVDQWNSSWHSSLPDLAQSSGQNKYCRPASRGRFIKLNWCCLVVRLVTYEAWRCLNITDTLGGTKNTLIAQLFWESRCNRSSNRCTRSTMAGLLPPPKRCQQDLLFCLPTRCTITMMYYMWLCWCMLQREWLWTCQQAHPCEFPKLSNFLYIPCNTFCLWSHQFPF